MSHKATNWAIHQRGLKPATKIVLWRLADRHNPDHGCFPSQDDLAADCEMSRSSLNDHLEKLTKAGLIRRVRRIDPITKRRMSTRYILGFEDDFAQEPTPKNGDGKPEKPCPKNGESRVRNSDTNLVREPVSTTTDFRASDDAAVAACLAACGPGLSRPARTVIRASDGVVHGWIAEGLDLEQDILPVLASRTANELLGVIQTWDYFSQAVRSAHRRRLRRMRAPSPASDRPSARLSGSKC